MSYKLVRALKNPIVWCGALIFALSVALYVQTAQFGFVEYDDQIYVYQNQQVMKGLCVPSIVWAFRDTAESSSNWHPLTFLSLMTDVSLFGVSAGAMHVHNAVLHGVDSVLLFIFLLMILSRLYGSPAGRGDMWIALIATLFWAVHPLRVESVAWVASRKDVLCIFWYLTGMMVCLSGLSRKEDRQRTAIWQVCGTGGCFLLAYMSKPTAVVFPFTMVLLEYAVTRRILWLRSGLFFCMAFVFMGVTVYAQSRGLALDQGKLSFLLRLPNAVAAIGQYVATTVFPHKLACFYPYEVPIPYGRLVPGCLFVLFVGDFLLRYLLPLVKAYPVALWQGKFLTPAEWSGGDERAISVLGYAVGLLWFLFSLLPVVGLLQVGIAACADRYTYLSGIGLSIVLLVLLRKVLKCRRVVQVSVSMAICFVLCILYVASYRQVSVWRNQLTLFSHAAASVKGNHLAHCNVGTWYFNRGNYADALYHFVESAKPLLTKQAVENLAGALSKLAGDDYTNDVFLHPITEDDPLAAMKYHALGLIAYYRKLDLSAETYLKKSGDKNPREYQVWEQLGFLYERQERMTEAEEMFAKASALNPSERGLRLKLHQITRQNAKKNP